MNSLNSKVLVLAVLIFTATGVVAQKKTSPVKAPQTCFLSEFRHLALSTYEPSARSAAAKDWLIRNVVSCSVEQLNLISSNRGNWLGTSDSPYFAYLLDSMIEYKLADKPEMLAQIFGSVGKEGSAGDGNAGVQVIGATQPSRTPVQPAYGYQQQYQPYQQQQAYPPGQQQPYYPEAAYPGPNAVGR